MGAASSKTPLYSIVSAAKSTKSKIERKLKSVQSEFDKLSFDISQTSTAYQGTQSHLNEMTTSADSSNPIVIKEIKKKQNELQSLSNRINNLILKQNKKQIEIEKLKFNLSYVNFAKKQINNQKLQYLKNKQTPKSNRSIQNYPAQSSVSAPKPPVNGPVVTPKPPLVATSTNPALSSRGQTNIPMGQMKGPIMRPIVPVRKPMGQMKGPVMRQRRQ